MKPKRVAKAYWEMSSEELQNITSDFDREFVAEQAKPLSSTMRARLERAKGKSTHHNNGIAMETITVELDKSLLAQCAVLAKRKRLSRDVLVARGLRALLAAEGEHL